jgi:hypothetical protein
LRDHIPSHGWKQPGADKLKTRRRLDSGVGCAFAVHKREGADMAIVYLEEDDDAADENRDAALTISEEWVIETYYLCKYLRAWLISPA